MPVLTPAELIQELDLPPRVEIFIVNYNDTDYYYTNTIRAAPIYWGGQLCTSLPISISGIGFTTENASEKPQVMVSSLQLSATIAKALKSSSLTYIITFETYIGTSSDGGTTITNNTSLFISKHRYKFAKLVSRNAKQAVYEMDTLLTWNNKQFPPRQILREGDLNFRFEGAGLYKI